MTIPPPPASDAQARLEGERIGLALAAGAIIGTWLWDVRADRITVDEAFADAFGIDPALAREGLCKAQVMESVHPDDVPALAAVLPDTGGDPHHLTAVEQESLPQAEELEDLLAQLAWPDQVDGAAAVVERLVVPPAAEAELQADEAAAVAALSNHPDAQDVRIAAGVLRTGESWCALRARSHDTDEQVVGGRAMVPGLVSALAATLA